MKKDIIEQNAEEPKTGTNENTPDMPCERLIEKEIKKFKGLLDSRQLDQLYKRYGLTLLYSLGPEDMVGYEKELGIKPQTAVDFFNHGVYYAENKNNASSAVKCFQKAIEIDNKLSQAHYDLALIYQEGKEDKLAKSELAEFIRLEEEKTKQSGKKMECRDGQVNYLEEAKKMLKGMK